MRNYFVERLRRLAPIFIEPVEDLPPADPEQVVEFSREFLRAGTPAFRVIFYAMIFVLQAICLLVRGKSVYSLPPEEADEFIQSLYNHRFTALSTIPTILGTPMYMAHYNRDDIQEPLGFDIAAMREEAAAREVQR
ncbi:MAG: hypothetical protein C4536_02940 [Actinobacteria bacterium]|jgi:hypothetical protein|nr:MAG: hypothetical protein C4536_02940 [Actinomycetota bacterium]